MSSAISFNLDESEILSSGDWLRYEVYVGRVETLWCGIGACQWSLSQTDRQMDRQTDTHTHRHTLTQRKRDRKRDTGKTTDNNLL